MAFRQNFTQQRWDRARELQNAYKLKTGKEESLREFYKNDNPFTQSVFKYEVTFEMSISGTDYEFFIPQESYTIYGYGAQMSIPEIEEMNKRAIASIFRGKAVNTVYNSTKVQVRGIEKVQAKYSEINVNELVNSNIYTNNLPNVQVGKGKNRGKANFNKYNLNIWL
jgi:hypothetical protein